MTIDELVKEASRLAPNLVVEVNDSTTYRTDVPAAREVVASVHPRAGHSAGSHEDIVIKMSRDAVVQIIPGGTTLFWQADPLVRALETSRVHDAINRE